YGNPAPSFGDDATVALANNPGGASLGGTLTATATKGVMNFAGLRLNKPGNSDTLQVTSGTLIPATSDGITVTPPAATRLVVTTPPPGSVAAGAPFCLTVADEDATGNVVTSFAGTVTVALANNPGGVALGGPLATTATGGVARFTGLT